MQELDTNLVRRHPGPPDAPMCGLHQSDGAPTLDVSASPRVGFPPLYGKAAGYYFSGKPSPPQPEAYQQRKQRKIIVDIFGRKPPSTSPSLPALTPVNTFQLSSPNGNWHLYSRRACREHYKSHSDRGQVSGVHPSVPYPLTLVWRLWLLWFCTWLDFSSASSLRNLRRCGGCRARERGWNLCW